MDRKPSITSRLVALAWVRGSINNVIVRALLGGCTATRAGTAICKAKDAGHLVETKATLPKAWGLSPERAEAIASMSSMPNLPSLRTEAEQLAQVAEQLAQVAQRVNEALAVLREQRNDQRKAATASAAIAKREAKREAKLEARRQARLAAVQADIAAHRAIKPAAAAPVWCAPSPVPAAAAQVQDPKGLLLLRTPDAAAGPPPVLVRGGCLAPSDGPYIRPDGLAHLAAPSRQGDALVAHRPPRSTP